MEENLGDFSDITINDVNNLPEPSPAFRIWVSEMMANGSLQKILKGLGLVNADVCGNPKEGLIFLSKLSKKVDIKNMNIACCDFVQNSNFAILRKLNLIMQNGRDVKDDGYLRFGQISHEVIRDIASKELFNLGEKKFRNFPMKQLKIFEREMEQLNLLPKEQPPKLPLDLKKIEYRWMLLSESIGETEWPHRRVENSIHTLELYNLLSPLIRRYASVFNKYQDSLGGLFAVNTVLSWVSAIVYFNRNSSRILFTEIPVFPVRQEVGGGRIDAIEVIAIDGREPNEQERKYLKDLAGFKHKSVGQLCRLLEKIFRKEINYRITDWKFTIGDGNGKEILLKSIPLDNHLSQIKKYLTLSSLSRTLDCGTRQKLWEKFESGQLFYILNHSSPVIYPVTIDSAQKEDLFYKQMVLKISDAERFAIIRTLTNHLVGHVVSKLEGKKRLVSQRKESLGKDDGKLLQFDERPLLTVINSYKFVDERKIIERRRNQLLLMHFDRLLEAIENGRVETKGIRSKGGFIRCLMPNHQDNNPSMYVSLKPAGNGHPRFKCFSCGAGGLIEKSSIPQHIREELGIANQSFFDGSKRREPVKTFDKFTAPDNLHKVMALAQGIFQSAFKKSKGEIYIRDERGIDPELAYRYGAGFCDDTLMHGLLDSGLSLDEMIALGFVGISEFKENRKSIADLLKRRGFNEPQIVRKMDILVLGKKIYRKKKDTYGYPVSTLKNRVTFPLEIGNRITNFYGRHVDAKDRKFYHYKMSVTCDGKSVSHGAFNNKVLYSDSSEVILTEAVLETLSLIQMGFNEAFGMIGIRNYTIFEEIVLAGKKIAIALNNDRPKEPECLNCYFYCPQGAGPKAARDLTELLVKRGLDVRNFTQEFLEKNPEARQYKDYNDFLRREKAIIKIK